MQQNQENQEKIEWMRQLDSELSKPLFVFRMASAHLLKQRSDAAMSGYAKQMITAATEAQEIVQRLATVVEELNKMTEGSNE